MKLKKGDEVIVTAGKDIGKRGKIERLFADGQKVFLPGLNTFKRHLKKRSEKDKGGIIDFSRPLPVSNIALICPKCHKPTRVGYKLDGDKKIRICRKCEGKI
ncbi:50S ribosomal protein L24 [Candidatus Gottesmanbacteria bacterium]|nr:50S ribosomal protein L24 [Candidatus Gottesmanbacteria bacterium]